MSTIWGLNYINSHFSSFMQLKERITYSNIKFAICENKNKIQTLIFQLLAV